MRGSSSQKSVRTILERLTLFRFVAAVRSSIRQTFLSSAGISKVGLDGTLYDQVLDWVFALGLAPSRFAKLSGYDLYFAMARGAEGSVALDMSKFFDTNYHYMVSSFKVSLLLLCLTPCSAVTV